MWCAESGQRQFPLWTHYVMYVSHLLLGKDACGGRRAERNGARAKESVQVGFTCPMNVQKFWKLTEVLHNLDCSGTVPRLTLYVTSFWTVIGR